MSFSETIFLFFLALIIFGPKKLPEIARQVGKYLNEFKRASNEFRSQIEQEISHLDTVKPQILPPSLGSSSWAGDSHTTEGLAPEGTASRTLASGNANSLDAQNSSDPSAATLAEPGNEVSSGHEILPASVATEGTTTEAAPVNGSAAASSSESDSAADPVATSATQESHA
jgi:sec-independent protein translocase protein TatB